LNFGFCYIQFFLSDIQTTLIFTYLKTKLLKIINKKLYVLLKLNISLNQQKYQVRQISYRKSIGSR